MAPPAIDDLLDYYDNKSVDHNNLHNLNIINSPLPPTKQKIYLQKKTDQS